MEEEEKKLERSEKNERRPHEFEEVQRGEKKHAKKSR